MLVPTSIEIPGFLSGGKALVTITQLQAEPADTAVGLCHCPQVFGFLGISQNLARLGQPCIGTPYASIFPAGLCSLYQDCVVASIHHLLHGATIGSAI